MAPLSIPDTGRCRWDFLSLGALIQRLDSGILPLHAADRLERWCAGAEYNPAANLSVAFRMRAAVATANVEYPPGWWVEAQVRKAGVEPIFKWFPYDGMRGPRIAEVWSDRGMGVRAPEVWYDRANEAGALLAPGDFDWKDIFERKGVRWFHSGGLFACLSETAAALIVEAMEAAHRAGAVVSYDVNYRKKLWDAFPGGAARAREVNRRIVEHVDVLFAGEEDLVERLGLTGPASAALPPAGRFRAAAEGARAVLPRLSLLASTLRSVHSASRHGLRGLSWYDGRFDETGEIECDVYDRIGSGDGFAAGLVYGFLTGKEPREALRLGWAHGALLTTYPGDTTMARPEQVQAVADGRGAGVTR
jgi:2-dehydro-3-deoxygluconokinase